MDIIDLKLFQKLFHTKNISEVAKQLYLTQPTISYRLNKMRDELEKKLYEYNGGFHFTESGKTLYNFCENVLKEYDKLLKDLESKQVIRMNMSTAARNKYLDKIYDLAMKNSAFPVINFTNSDDAICDLIDNKVTAALVGGLKIELSRKEYFIRELETEKIILVYNSECSEDDINKIPIINDEMNSGLYEYILDYLEEYENKKVIAEVGTFKEKLPLIEDHKAGCFIPESYFQEQKKEFPNIIPSEKHSFSRSILLVFKKEAMNNFFIKSLIEEFI
ncbi:MAG: LysR family transcriptional regulator [Spirochaetia bacterium]